MKNIEGQLEINLYPQRKNTARVELSSSRPLHAAKVFVGKTPEQALAVMPLLFSVCGIAQSRAALTAVQQNLNIDSTPKLETARDMLVLVENAKEHLLRLFIDWPTLFKLKTSNDKLPYLGKMLNDFKITLFQDGAGFNLNTQLNASLKNTGQLIDKLEQYLQQHVYCQNAQNWLKIKNIQGLHDWTQQCNSIAASSINIICQQGWASQGLTDCRQLPLLDEKQLLEQFNSGKAQQFIAQPQWHGRCYETTVLTRQFKQPLIQALHTEFHSTLITRWVARLVELATIPQQLRNMLKQLVNNDKKDTDNTHNIKDNKGLAQIEAARGRLIHRVEIKQNIITNYQILAPTEWNFHPQGVVAKSLCSLTNSKNKDDIEKLAHLVINAIDPCVGYRLRIH